MLTYISQTIAHSFSLTLPLIQRHRGVVVTIVIRLRLRKIIRVPQVVEERVLKSHFCSEPFVSIQDEHFLQEVDP